MLTNHVDVLINLHDKLMALVCFNVTEAQAHTSNLSVIFYTF